MKCLIVILVIFNYLAVITLSAAPTLVINGDSSTMANDEVSITFGKSYGKKLMYKGQDLIKNAVGAYASYGGSNTLQFSTPTIYRQSTTMLDVSYPSPQGELHYVMFTGLPGFYSYFVNKALGTQGEFRTLIRLDNVTFPNGRNDIKSGALPTLAEIDAAVKVQDETWRRPDGTYITKYDWTSFVRGIDFHGVYGSKFGAWLIAPGKDYYNGDQLKQELTVHRESSSGDAVLLNMLHGTHFQCDAPNVIPVGKIWGPYLWYFNDGSISDATARTAQENKAWPYEWFDDKNYQSRGTVTGRLVLSDGRSASGAAVFLGDTSNPNSTLSEGTTYYYTTYADSQGNFVFDNVRTGQYGLEAWSNGGSIGNVTTVYKKAPISVTASTNNVGTLTWTVQKRTVIWQIGDMDRKSLGFTYGGAPHQHALVDKCPATFTYTVGTTPLNQWCFGKSAAGTWTVSFTLTQVVSSAILTLSIAGYSTGTSLSISLNNNNIGSIPSSEPNDPCLYRSGTTAGEWRYLEYSVPTKALQVGKNTLELDTTKGDQWHGVMWDSILLEWA